MNRIKEIPSRWALGDFLREELGEGTVGAELGVATGNHANELIRVVMPKEIHLVDWWRLSPTNPGRGADEWKVIRHRFDARIAEGIVVLHEGEFVDVLKRFPDRFFDWLYVDGWHRYADVSRDIEAAVPKIRPGGILCGHDFTILPDDWKTGVCRAVIEAVMNGVGPMIALSNSVYGDWAIRVAGPKS